MAELLKYGSIKNKSSSEQMDFFHEMIKAVYKRDPTFMSEMEKFLKQFFLDNPLDERINARYRSVHLKDRRYFGECMKRKGSAALAQAINQVAEGSLIMSIRALIHRFAANWNGLTVMQAATLLESLNFDLRYLGPLARHPKYPE